MCTVSRPTVGTGFTAHVAQQNDDRRFYRSLGVQPRSRSTRNFTKLRRSFTSCAVSCRWVIASPQSCPHAMLLSIVVGVFAADSSLASILSQRNFTRFIVVTGSMRPRWCISSASKIPPISVTAGARCEGMLKCTTPSSSITCSTTRSDTSDRRTFSVSLALGGTWPQVRVALAQCFAWCGAASLSMAASNPERDATASAIAAPILLSIYLHAQVQTQLDGQMWSKYSSMCLQLQQAQQNFADAHPKTNPGKKWSVFAQLFLPWAQLDLLTHAQTQVEVECGRVFKLCVPITHTPHIPGFCMHPVCLMYARQSHVAVLQPCNNSVRLHVL